MASGDLRVLTRGASGGPRAPRGAPDEVLRQAITALRILTQLVRIVPLALHQKRARVRGARRKDIKKEKVFFSFFISFVFSPLNMLQEVLLLLLSCFLIRMSHSGCLLLAFLFLCFLLVM